MKSINRMINESFDRLFGQTDSKLNDCELYTEDVDLLSEAPTFDYNDDIIDVTNIYFDNSGSFYDDNKNNKLRSYVSNKLLTMGLDKSEINIYYFAEYVNEFPEATGLIRTNIEAVLQHIDETQPDNVVIVTDEDFLHPTIAKKVNIPGSLYVFFVTRDLYYASRAKLVFPSLIKADENFKLTTIRLPNDKPLGRK